MEKIGEDKIIIKDLLLHAHIGCTKEERSYPQRLFLDLELGLDTREAAATKDIDKTVCYSTLKQQLESLIVEKEWTLIEELAEEVCKFTFVQASRVISIRVRLRKFALPDTAWVGVEITRRR